MAAFIGLDVSRKSTAICIVDQEGRRLWRGQWVSAPEAIARAIERQEAEDAVIGLETGPMSTWLVHELRPVPSTSFALMPATRKQLQVNKNDRNDAEGIAHIMRTGWHRPVHVKSFDGHRIRALLGARLQLVGMVTRISNHIRGVLKTFGLLPGGMRGKPFTERVEALVADRPDVAPIILPMLAARSKLREQIIAFDKAIRAEVKRSPACRLLMTAPGMGPITVLAYVSAIEEPGRFSRSRAVGAHLGLTPQQYQSGETDRSGRISKCGDELARLCLYEAANVILSRVKRPFALKSWAQNIAKRSGNSKARVALARKLAVILHRIWISGHPFDWGLPATA